MTDTVNVPREPTEGMLVAGARAVEDFYSCGGPYPRAKAMYRAFIAAAPASDELLEALAPFARYYDLNDCHERRPDDALEVPIYDLARAAELIAKHKGPQS